MRKQFLARLALVGGTLLGPPIWSGCSDITAGQVSDPTGPAKIVHVMVQDADGAGNGRAYVTDLLDNSDGPACDDLNPCAHNFLLAQGNNRDADFSCQPNHFCNNPLKKADVALEPAIPGTKKTGIQVRIVFNKLLDNSIEDTTSMITPTTPLGKDITYKLKDGIVSLTDEGGVEVTTLKSWIPIGAPDATSDPITAPFGPALAMDTLVFLDSATTYTIKMEPGQLHDRKQNPVAGPDGTVLSSTYSINFTTEAIDSSGTNPGKATDMTKPASLKANDVFQVQFWGAVDETSWTGSVTDASGNPVAVLAYTERGANPAMCSANADPKTLNLFPGTLSADGKTATLTNWAPGTYKLHVVIKDKHGHSTYTSAKDFYITTTSDIGDATDKSAVANHLHPAQCTG